MKQLIITCICTLAAVQLYAQNTAGKVYYTETAKMNLNLKDADVKVEGADISAEQIMAMIPKEQVNKKVLYFNEDGCLYEAAKAENTDATTQQGDMHIITCFAGNDSRNYTDIKNGKLIEQEDFMSRKFLIASDIKKDAWKITGEQKQILGYPCQQATLQRDTQKIVAWFTSAIPVSAGPTGFGGLPGMILELQPATGYTIVASKVDMNAPDRKSLTKPSEGKKVTREQYNKIVEAKVKERQGEEGSHGGNISIRTFTR